MDKNGMMKWVSNNKNVRELNEVNNFFFLNFENVSFLILGDVAVGTIVTMISLCVPCLPVPVVVSEASPDGSYQHHSIHPFYCFLQHIIIPVM